MKKYTYMIMLVVIVILVGCNRQADSNENKIETISYESSSFGVISEAVEVDMKNQTKKIFINEDFRKGGSPTDFEKIPDNLFKTYKIEKISAFKQAIKEIGMESWKEEYIDKKIMDGHQWTMIIKYQDGTEKSIYGSNDAPKKFDDLLKILKNTES